MKKALVILLVASLLVMPLAACSKIRISQDSEPAMSESALNSESTTTSIPQPTSSSTPLPQPTSTQTPTLTIKSVEIVLGNGSFDINPVTAVDETGKEIVLPSLGEWFEGNPVVNIFMPEGTNMQITENGVFLAEDSALEISIETGDKKYTCLLKVGSRFNYTSDGSDKIKIIINDAFTLEGSDENKGSADTSDTSGASCPSDTATPNASSTQSGENTTENAISNDTPAPTSTPKSEPEKVVFNDSKLEDVVRSTIGKPSGTVTVDDVKKVTYLDATGKGIKDISVLKYFVSLQVLHIEENNEIADLSPLKQLVSLKELYGYGNKITDLSPLKNLVGLEKLYLCWNNFSDLSPLSGLKNLQELSFGDMSVTDLSPLKDLTKLRILRAYGNKITDISPLRNLKNLVELDLSGNPIKDYSPIEGLNIQNLYK